MSEEIKSPSFTIRNRNYRLIDSIQGKMNSMYVSTFIRFFIGFNSKTLASIENDEKYNGEVERIKNNISQIKEYFSKLQEISKNNKKKLNIKTRRYLKYNSKYLIRKLDRTENRLNIIGLRREVEVLKKDKITNKGKIAEKNSQIISNIKSMMKNTISGRLFTDLTAELVAQEKGFSNEDIGKFKKEFRGTLGISKESRYISNFQRKISFNFGKKADRFKKDSEKLKEMISNKAERYEKRQNSKEKEPKWKTIFRQNKNLPMTDRSQIIQNNISLIKSTNFSNFLS